MEEADRRYKADLKAGITPDATMLQIEEPEKPLEKRYIAQDATYEKLGEILMANPNGVLVHRDELISLLKSLDDESNIASRGFYLTAWNGSSPYDFDRIGRGKTHIPHACLSLLVTTQPGRISGYLQEANSGGIGDDGLIQRFNLFVWPDPSKEWKEIDRYPNKEAEDAAWETFKRLNTLTAEDAGAENGEEDELLFLRFDDEAQKEFSIWRKDLEDRLRGGELGHAMESHLAKFRMLIPSLALINHLANGCKGPIGIHPLFKAFAFSEYLESHARRAYGVIAEPRTNGRHDQGSQLDVLIDHRVFELHEAMRNPAPAAVS
jgi:putative DNA primase/helicase